MRAWKRPDIVSVPGESSAPWLHDTKTDSLVLARPRDAARLYVCGITPYDATHLGHANTYLAFDTLQRVWIDAGFRVHYAQNVTDIDDPLLERATATGVDWRDLAESQVELFRADMEALGIIPPNDFVAVTEVIDEVAAAVALLRDAGLAYPVPTDDAIGGADGTIAADLYFDIRAAEASTDWTLGEESNLDPVSMLRLFAERGGDPDRAGKRDRLDPLLWRAARAGEPAWESAVGAGRPGWHIECSVIALKELGTDFTVQGGGSDLIFPHHDMSAGHAQALSGHPLAGVYSHTGMVAYRGEKMSKSLGNLVLVSGLRAHNVDPRAIRLALLARHYRTDWEWTTALLDEAVERLSVWAAAFGTAVVTGTSRATNLGTANIAGTTRTAASIVQSVRLALRHDLDTPQAMQLIDAAAAGPLDDPALLNRAISALLGVAL
ncbi:MAG: cysteine--1-D-myo-inosityl 2-amino-2-deoxy-alpha-D-glucopyranoside ligase [Cryobacterium sp.]|uniref:cysteine--1-D-myo-inosityl 2-amino-2-deoxy-alpha-D-glucopyranoside ligase n=1 Tax=unclassified Cryobacterium TaxID=2649013 RepID=UPI0018CBED57|nr:MULTISPECIES: cysteine--1-D-myo-inosityl 2-amino-2-deoxy-alpha-D-glucopyranoside ligase [unclassified Cryobacterium]MCY7404354.1 cysteine--1-D-myo-inosityl 2-amino-2-deoxy-alpha-D-glucopyranoside ligase [Cryobacterium sp.]MEC5154647.1 L-cysteine:1D-myo-inositol 2-amino-2-deoxy-alpha-D-glucopyranoside ligase [Cryobacterium sp. CAN_C3]